MSELTWPTGGGYGTQVVTHRVRVQPPRSMKAITGDVEALLGGMDEGARRSGGLLASELVARLPPEPPHRAPPPPDRSHDARKYFFEPNPNPKGQAMPKEITSDQVVAAAEGLGKAEFTRSDLAQKLGVEKPKEFSQGFRQARRAGRLDKVRDDEEGTGHFRLTSSS
jgi:hypothetical protein